MAGAYIRQFCKTLPRLKISALLFSCPLTIVDSENLRPGGHWLSDTGCGPRDGALSGEGCRRGVVRGGQGHKEQERGVVWSGEAGGVLVSFMSGLLSSVVSLRESTVKCCQSSSTAMAARRHIWRRDRPPSASEHCQRASQ